jgi:hypothetical protein
MAMQPVDLSQLSLNYRYIAGSGQGREDSYAYDFTGADGKDYTFVPESVVNRGITGSGDSQLVLPWFLNQDNLSTLVNNSHKVDFSSMPIPGVDGKDVTGKEYFGDLSKNSPAGFLFEAGSIPFDSSIQVNPKANGEITGMAMFQGQPVYVRSSGSGDVVSYMSDEGTGFRGHTITYTKGRSILGDIFGGAGDAVADMVNGGLDAFNSLGPIGNAVITAWSPTAGAAIAGANTGKAIQSGAPLGTIAANLAANYAGSQIGAEIGADVGNQAAGQFAGSTASGVLKGQNLDSALTNAAMNTAGSQAGQAASDVIKDATASGALPVPPVNSGGTSVMGPSADLPPADASNPDQKPWLPDANNPNLEAGPTPAERQAAELASSQNPPAPLSSENLPKQDFGKTPDVNIPLYKQGSTGFSSGWQTVGSDRIMVQDDGTAIGMNENGDPYSLGTDKVQEMVSNGLLNSDTSGYTAATQGTNEGITIPPNLISTGLRGLISNQVANAVQNTGTAGAQNPTSSPLASTQLMAGKNLQGNSTGDPYYLQKLHQLYDTLTPNMPDKNTQSPLTMAAGGTATDPNATEDPFPIAKTGVSNKPFYGGGTRKSVALAPLQQLKSSIVPARGMANGGLPEKYAAAAPAGHKPEFITGMTGYYASGNGTGQSDDIPAMLHDGDYVADADLVAALGDGSSKAGAEALEKFRRSIPQQHHAEGGQPVAAKIADGEYVFPASFVTAIGQGNNKTGAKILDKMREAIRSHKRSAPDSKIPPKAKSPLDYLKMAKG